MRTFSKLALGIVLGGAMLASTAVAYGADVRPAEKFTTAHSFRASKLTGLNVRNNAGEKLGVVEDLVVNIETGKIAYVALGVGGVLGVGEKMFAVPFTEMKFDSGKDEIYFVLDMSKDKLKAAPGFDKHDWPNFADPNWSQHIDDYYRHSQTTTTGNKTSE